MAKLVDAIGLGPIGRNAVLVRVQSVAPLNGSSQNHSLPLPLPLPLFFSIPLRAMPFSMKRRTHALHVHGRIHGLQRLQMLEVFDMDPLASTALRAP